MADRRGQRVVHRGRGRQIGDTRQAPFQVLFGGRRFVLLPPADRSDQGADGGRHVIGNGLVRHVGRNGSRGRQPQRFHTFDIAPIGAIDEEGRAEDDGDRQHELLRRLDGEVVLGLGAGVDTEVLLIELERGLVSILEAGLLLDGLDHHFRFEAQQLL
ncbi:hypothetical protein D3C76_1356110 [compost metagenome]